MGDGEKGGGGGEEEQGKSRGNREQTQGKEGEQGRREHRAEALRTPPEMRSRAVGTVTSGLG